MPNRGKLVDREKIDFDQKFVYNVLKRSLKLDTESFKKSEKARTENGLKHAAHQVQRVMELHEGEADVGRTLDALANLKLHVQHPDVPQSLGRELGRRIFEELLGQQQVLDPNEEYVSHSDKPGKPAPVNLYTTSPFGSDDEADAGMSSGDDGADASAIASESGMPSGVEATSLRLPGSIYLLEYGRSPKEWLNALKFANELSACRDGLLTHGLTCVLKGGAKAFVRPDQYGFVAKIAQSQNLKPRHVFVSEEFEDSLQDALTGIGKGIKLKGKLPVPPQPLVIKRTFLEGPVPTSLRSDPNSDPVTQSTTDANPRTPINARRA